MQGERRTVANVLMNQLAAAGVDPDAVSAAELAKLIDARARIPRPAFAEALSASAEPGFSAEKYLGDNAKGFEDIRIAAAAFEATGHRPPQADDWVKEIASLRNANGTYGKVNDRISHRHRTPAIEPAPMSNGLVERVEQSTTNT